MDQGVCTARKTVDTPDEDAIVFAMVDPNSTDSIRKAVINDLFGQAVSTIWEASVRNVQLPRHQIKELTEKKMKSLSAKYFSISAALTLLSIGAGCRSECPCPER